MAHCVSGPHPRLSSCEVIELREAHHTQDRALNLRSALDCEPQILRGSRTAVWTTNFVQKGATFRESWTRDVHGDLPVLRRCLCGGCGNAPRTRPRRLPDRSPLQTVGQLLTNSARLFVFWLAGRGGKSGRWEF